jgi:sialate O-acetylesterase
MAEYKTLVEKWQAEKDKAKKEGKPFKKRKPYIGHYRSPATYSQYPGSLFNRLINPFLPYAIAGVVWYQGESNGNKDAKYYESTFKAMIQDWRKRFGQGDIPFYYVQLPNLGHKTTNPYLSDWGIIREAQRKTLELPNTGMAVTIDIGEDNNIHPHNKIEVGKRLARWALNKNYGQEKLVYSGPLYKSAKAENGKLIITFDEAGSGLMVGKKADMWAPVEKSDAELAQFFVAGKDEVFKPAKAKITGKDTVEVWAESIKEPVYIRFGTAKNPVGINLYNKEGLPASPFYNK